MGHLSRKTVSFHPATSRLSGESCILDTVSGEKTREERLYGEKAFTHLGPEGIHIISTHTILMKTSQMAHREMQTICAGKEQKILGNNPLMAGNIF